MRTRSPVRVAMTCQRMPRWQKWAPRLASSGSWRTSTLGSSSPSRMTTLGKLRAAFPASSPSDRRSRLRSSWLFTSYLWKKKKQEPCPSAKPLLQVYVRGGLLISGTRCPYRHDLPRGHGVALRCRSLARIFHQLSAAAGDAPAHSGSRRNGSLPSSFSRLGVLDVLRSTAPRPSGRKPRYARHLAALATEPGEICG